MKKERTARPEDNDFEMREEYDFTADDFRNAVRGKYAEWYARGTNVILLDPDVADIFPDSAAVNQALRALASIIRERTKAPAA